MKKKAKELKVEDIVKDNCIILESVADGFGCYCVREEFDIDNTDEYTVSPVGICDYYEIEDKD